MNTETGQVYEPGDVEKTRRRIAQKRMEDLSAAEQEFARADAAGQIVPISDRVAHLMKGAHTAEKKRKRKATKKSRKRNR